MVHPPIGLDRDRTDRHQDAVFHDQTLARAWVAIDEAAFTEQLARPELRELERTIGGTALNADVATVDNVQFLAFLSLFEDGGARFEMHLGRAVG